MNVQSIVLLMAVMAVGSMGAASQAFAAVPLDIEVNGDTFDHALYNCSRWSSRRH